MIEHCRECRDVFPYGAPPVPAEFILWGKLFAPEAFGPRCYEHAEKHLGHSAMSQLGMYAVFDLRPVIAMQTELEEATFRLESLDK